MLPDAYLANVLAGDDNPDEALDPAVPLCGAEHAELPAKRPRPNRRPRRAITEDEAQRIHADYKIPGTTKRALAQKYNRHALTIAQVLDRQYAKIPPAPPLPPPVRYVHMKRSAGRRSEYCKIITGVRASLDCGGFALTGDFARPGSRVPEDRVFRDGAVFAIVLECSGPDREAGLQHLPDGSGQARFPKKFLLWRVERDSFAWRELARTSAITTEVAIDLGPIAARYLSSADAGVKLSPRVEAIAARIITSWREELARVEACDLELVLALLHDPVGEILVSFLDNPIPRRPPAREIEARIVLDDEKEDVG